MQSRRSYFSTCVILLNVLFEHLSMCIRTSPAYVHQEAFLAKETDVTSHGRWPGASPDPQGMIRAWKRFARSDKKRAKSIEIIHGNILRQGF
jgi:hypothetical protein